MAPPPKIELAPISGVGKTTAVSHSQVVSIPTSLGILLLLPPEIRLKIYRDLITAGSVRFLETCRAVHNEAIEVLLKEGVCRLEFNVCKPGEIYPSQDLANTILNLEIRLNLANEIQNAPWFAVGCINDLNMWLSRINDGRYAPHNYQTPTHPTPRKCCNILLDHYSGFKGNLPSSTFEIIQRLAGFETLVLAIADDYTPETRRRFRDRMYNPRPDPRRDMESAMHSKENANTLHAYQAARVALEPTLGPAELVCDEKGAHLEFHPRA